MCPLHGVVVGIGYGNTYLKVFRQNLARGRCSEMATSMMTMVEGACCCSAESSPAGLLVSLYVMEYVTQTTPQHVIGYYALKSLRPSISAGEVKRTCRNLISLTARVSPHYKTFFVGLSELCLELHIFGSKKWKGRVQNRNAAGPSRLPAPRSFSRTCGLYFLATHRVSKQPAGAEGQISALTTKS